MILKNPENGESRATRRNRRIAWSAVSAVGSKVISGVCGILHVPLVVGYLGKEQYGLWLAISSLVVWIQLMDFGFTGGLTNALAEANGRDEPKLAAEYLSASFLITLVLSLVFILFFVLFFPERLLGELLNFKDPGLERLGHRAVMMLVVSFSLNIPLSLSGRVLIGYQKGYVWNAILSLTSIFHLILMWAAVKWDFGVLELIGLSSGVPLLSSLVAWVFVLKDGFVLRLDIRSLGNRNLARVWRSSFPLLIFQLGALAVNQLVNVVIARRASLEMVADYQITQRIYTFIFALGASVSSPFGVAIREAVERRDFGWARGALRNFVLLRLACVFPFVLLLVHYGDQIITLWIGKSVVSELGSMGWMTLGACMISSTISSGLSEILMALDDIWSQVILVLITAAVVIAAMISLLPEWKVPGVYLAMSVSTLLPMVVCMIRLRRGILSSREVNG